MQYSENFGLKEPEYGEKAKVDDLNFNTEKIDTIMGNNRSMIAEYFDQTQSYLAGKVVQLNGKTYRFKVDHAPGNFNPSEVDEEPLGNFIGEGGGSADVTKTASGNPITFDDGASAPLVKCVTAITGSQDLHGYDKPWVGGAGKNKLPLVLADIKSANTSGTWSGNAYTIYNVTFTVNTDNDGNVTSITVNGTASANADFKLASSFTLTAGSYIASNEGSGTSYYGQIENGSTWSNRIVTNTPQTITYSSDGVIYHFYVSNGSSVSNVEIHPMIRLSTETDPTFTPYSNICPITAYTEGEIEVRGKNLFNKNASDIAVGFYLIASTGVLSPSQSGYNTSGYIPIEPNTYYTKSGASVAADEYCFFDSEKTFISGLSRTDTTVLSPNNAAYMRFDYKASETDNIQIEKGSTATTYEPYTSTTHTTTYPSAIFRGSEDVVKGDVKCEMPVYDMADVTTFNNASQTDDTIVIYIVLGQDPYFPKNKNTAIISNRFSVDIPTGVQGRMVLLQGGQLYFVLPKSELTSLDDAGFVAWFTDHPTQICYELATPTTSSVTPTNLPIKSLSGYNHIESSTGDMEVEYITQEYQPIVDLIESNSGKHVYSTNEQVVGTWTDGKDVYEKTIYYATLSCDRNDWAQLEALDAETFISYSATAHMETASGRQIDNNYIRISYYNGYLYHHEPEFGTGMVDLYVTVRYTKPSSNTRSLNLTKSAVEEIPDEIKNAPFEEKPDVNEADDDAPTEVDER